MGKDADTNPSHTLELNWKKLQIKHVSGEWIKGKLVIAFLKKG